MKNLNQKLIAWLLAMTAASALAAQTPKPPLIPPGPTEWSATSTPHAGDGTARPQAGAPDRAIDGNNHIWFAWVSKAYGSGTKEAPGDHWLQVRFGRQTLKLKGVIVGLLGGGESDVQVQVPDGNGWKTVGEYKGNSENQSQTITFAEPVGTGELRFLTPAASIADRVVRISEVMPILENGHVITTVDPAHQAALAQAMKWVKPVEGAKELQLKSGDIICYLGDSITHIGDYCRVVDAVVAAQYPELTVKPAFIAGIDGQRAEDMKQRIDGLIKMKPTFMVINSGVNDYLRAKEKPRTDEVAVKAYRDDLTEMVEKAQQAGIKVILMTPTVLGEGSEYDDNGKRDRYSMLLDAMHEVAKEKNCPVADNHALGWEMLIHLPEFNDRLPQDYKKNGKVSHGFLTRDGAHPLPLGDAAMAIGILRALGVPDSKITTKIVQ